MTAEMDELDRKVGRPVASYSLEDLRRMFLRGQSVPEAPAAMPGAMPAAVEAMMPPISDALAGPPLPGPVTAAALPTVSPEARAVMARNAPAGMRPVMPPPPAPSVAAAAPARAAGDYMPFQTPATLPGPAPMALDGNLPLPPVPAGLDIPGLVAGEANAAPVRLDPIQLARALKSYKFKEFDPTSFAARFARTQR